MATEVESSTATGEAAAQRTKRRVRVGVVSSAGRDKTIRVDCSFMIRHPKYNKYLRRRTRLTAHDANNEAKIGDRVEIMECRPISKTKHWCLRKVLSA